MKQPWIIVFHDSGAVLPMVMVLLMSLHLGVRSFKNRGSGDGFSQALGSLSGLFHFMLSHSSQRAKAEIVMTLLRPNLGSRTISFLSPSIGQNKSKPSPDLRGRELDSAF